MELRTFILFCYIYDEPIHYWVIMLAQLCSLLVDRIVKNNKRFRDQDIDDTANDTDINLSCEVNIIANISVHLLKNQVKALKSQQNFKNTLLIK